jgi:hypothetical protein
MDVYINSFGKATIISVLFLCLFFFSPTFADNQEITVISYSHDNSNILNEKTISLDEIKNSMAAVGGADGIVLKFQGPTFEQDNLWDPEQTVNIDGLQATVIGVPVSELLAFADVSSDAANITFVASDGYKKTLPADIFFNTPKEQGEAIIAYWYADEEDFESSGFRLFFNAPDGIYGNNDMKETLPEAYWHWYFDAASQTRYPSAKGLSAMQITNIDIQMPEESLNTIEVKSDPISEVPSDLNSNETLNETDAEIAETGEQTIIYSGNVPVTDENITVTTSSGATYDIKANTPLGVLQELADQGTLSIVSGDKAFEKKGILLLDAINTYSFGDGENTWFVVVNDYQLQDFGLSETDGLNIYTLNSGDVVTYYYGLPVNPASEAEAAIIITIE